MRHYTGACELIRANVTTPAMAWLTIENESIWYGKIVAGNFDWHTPPATTKG